MANATLQPAQPTASAERIRWGRIAIGAVLLEAALVAAAIPLFALVDSPFTATPGAAGDYTLLFALIAAMCFVAGALAGAWVARPLASSLARHGLLTGVAATVIYLAICSIPPNTVAAVVAVYGPFWFTVANGLRIAGATIGAAYRRGRV